MRVQEHTLITKSLFMIENIYIILIYVYSDRKSQRYAKSTNCVAQDHMTRQESRGIRQIR